MTVNTGDILESVVHGMLTGGKEMVNVYHWRYEGASISDSTLVTEGTTMLVGMMARVLAVLSTAATYSFVVWNNRTQNRELGTANLSQAGQAATDSLPSGVAAQVTGRTQVQGRRGRKFLWGFNEGATSIQQLTTTALAALASYAAYWLAGRSWDSGTKKLVCGVLKEVGELFTTISVMAANGTPAYQRRRKPTA